MIFSRQPDKTTMNTEHATPELFASLCMAQAEVENAAKTSSNPHFKSKYADLAEVINTVRPVYTKHGLAIIQAPRYDGTLATVDTIIAHKGGGFISSSASCVPAKTDGQGVGAATTYLRRYALAAMTGIAQEDDDGNSAAHNKPVPASPFIISGIKDKLAELSVDEAAFLKYLGATSVDALTAEQAKRAQASLAKKEQQMAEAQAAVAQAAAKQPSTRKTLDDLIDEAPEQ